MSLFYTCKGLMEDGLFERFQIRRLRELESAQGPRFIRKRAELLHDLLLLGEGFLVIPMQATCHLNLSCDLVF